MTLYEHKMSKIYIFLFLNILIFLIGICKIKANQFPLMGITIYLDPGHGGLDPGSIYKNIYEKDINLEICKRLNRKLTSLGAVVYMTRDGDYDLSNINSTQRKKSDLNNRAKIINESSADMYISIHLNSVSSSTWHGIQVFYDDVNNKNIVLANMFQEQFKKSLNTTRDVKEIKTMLLNRKIKIPGILIEAGFLSNSNDRYLLRQPNYQEKLADNISKVLISYYN